MKNNNNNINIWERNHIYPRVIYVLHFFKQHLNVFVDLVYRWGLKKENAF